MSVTEPIKKRNDVKKLAGYYLREGQFRNHALIVLGIHTALRISDLLKLTWGDIYDFKQKKPYRVVELTEAKTGKRKSIALNADALQALCLLLCDMPKVSPRQFVFSSQKTKLAPITRVQAYRIIKDGARAMNLPENISCHSLRKTFGYHAWKGNIPLPVIMDIYNHSSFSATKHYLGVGQEERDKVYLAMSFFADKEALEQRLPNLGKYKF
jgi:integrase